MLFELKTLEVERLVAVVVVAVVGPVVVCVCVSVRVVVGVVAENVTVAMLAPRKKRSDVTVTSTAPLPFNQLSPLVTKSIPLTHFLGRFLNLYRPI